jgi:Zn-dependent peptidase ImmA (M78 family)
MLSEEEIRIKANQLLEATQMESQFPLPIEKIASYLGFKCHLYIPDEDIKDIASALSHTKKKIYVNQDNPFEQQLYTVARKIGHIVLHGDDRDYIDEAKPTTDWQAKEAETFAIHLLMPDKAFQEMWLQYPNNFAILALYFGVTASIVEAKANSLGLLSTEF